MDGPRVEPPMTFDQYLAAFALKMVWSSDLPAVAEQALREGYDSVDLVALLAQSRRRTAAICPSSSNPPSARHSSYPASTPRHGQPSHTRGPLLPEALGKGARA